MNCSFLFVFTNLDRQCASSPCENGATCNEDDVPFTCTCAPGYQGDLCNEGNWFVKFMWLVSSYLSVEYIFEFR